MKINLRPVRSDNTLSVVKQGDLLTINSVNYDFSQLPDGATLPTEAVDSSWFERPGVVERVNGELHLTLLLPHGANPAHHVAFPEPITVTADGPIKLPTTEVDDVAD